MVRKRLFSFFSSTILAVAVTCLCLCVIEIAFRWIGGYRIESLTLALQPGHDTDPPEASMDYAKQRVLDPTFDISWYSTDPPDYDRSPKYDIPADWRDAITNYKTSPGERDFVKEELQFLYNYNWLVNACRTDFRKRSPTNVLRHYKRFPGFVYAFASPDGSTRPPYRLVPTGWERSNNYYNNFGFRGPDMAPRKSARMIRLAFLGSSATANGWPFTYPEYAGYFLQLWAKASKLDVDIEVINAGRGGITTLIIDKIMRYEVAPLHPDIVVYYEGGNDFHARDVVNPQGGRQYVNVLGSRMDIQYLPLEQYSATLDRVYELLFRRGGAAAEPPKPPHTLTFDVKQRNPDIERGDLPFRLHSQVTNLRDIATVAKSVGAEFFLASFVTLGHDGLLLDPERHRNILQGLNGEYFPMTYGEIRESIDFENAVYRKLARTDHHPFLDVDRYFPQDPDFFADMVHFGTSGGFRLQGWIVAQLLAPYIRAAIANGSLPKPEYDPDPKAIAWATDPPIKFDLSCLP
jgi:hypothetical protein